MDRGQLLYQVRQAWLLVSLADKSCPKYRANFVKLRSLTTQLGLKDYELDPLAWDAPMRLVADRAREMLGSDPQEFCNRVWDAYGDSGEMPGYLRRRD